MPSRLPSHKPHRPLPDQRVRDLDKARHAGRALPYSGRQWQAIRKAALDRDPLCRACGDVAREVDHIDGDNGNNRPDNLQGLCKPCHSSKTAREQGKKIASNRAAQHRPPSVMHANAKLVSP